MRRDGSGYRIRADVWREAVRTLKEPKDGKPRSLKEIIEEFESYERACRISADEIEAPNQVEGNLNVRLWLKGSPESSGALIHLTREEYDLFLSIVGFSDTDEPDRLQAELDADRRRLNLAREALDVMKQNRQPDGSSPTSVLTGEQKAALTEMLEAELETLGEER